MSPPTERADTLRPLALAAGLAAAMAVWSLPTPMPLALAALAAAVLLATVRPDLAVAVAPLTFPWTFHPRAVGSAQVTPAEALLAVLLMGLTARLVLERLPAARALGHTGAVVVTAPPRWFAGSALALLLVAVWSLLLVTDPTNRQPSLVEFRKVVLQPLLFAGAAWVALSSRQAVWRAAVGLLLAGAFTALVAGAQLALGLAGVAAEGVRRAMAPYQHPNNLALFLGRAVALGAPLAFGGGWRSGLLLGGAALGAAAGVALTFSRGAWLALPAALALVALLSGRRRLAGGLLGTGLALLLVLPFSGIERLNRVLEGGSGTLRLELWQSTLAMLADHPLTGVGLDQFLYRFGTRYVSPGAWAERFTAHPHNWVLDFWARLGLPGLAVAVAMFGLTLAAAVRLTRRRNGHGERLLAAGSAGLICYSLLHGLVDSAYFVPDLALVFWLTAAIVARLERLADGAVTDRAGGDRPSTQ